jgi:hypothetical protein
MPNSVKGSNVSSQLPLREPAGATTLSPAAAGAPQTPIVVPAPAMLTINGVSTPIMNLRYLQLIDVVNIINALGTGTIASIDYYGHLQLTNPNGVVVGGDAATRAVFGI